MRVLLTRTTRWQILRKLIIPLAKSGMIAVFLVVMLTTWNSFLIPLIFTRTADSQTMTVVLTLFIALFFQRYLVRGLTMGAVKV